MKPAEEAPKQKCRHIVTWTPQEDDMLREQIRIHGAESWTAIAARFKDKTSRQCRRRWYTYLSTDCKKGGWSPEEDVLLCEAQKIFGNRWTEIAKVVAGRTDNAVKNRFTTLCKKRAKQEALSKENSTVCINANNKRVILQNGSVASEIFESQVPPLKKIRDYNSDLTENCSRKSVGECGVEKQQLLRPPLSAVQNKKGNDHSTQQCIFNGDNMVSSEASDNTDQDPKAVALIQQQEELLSSLAAKVSDDTHQGIENAWKELQHFLIQSEESELLRYKILEMDSLLEDFKYLVQDTKGNAGSWPSWRQPDWHEESQGSSEYSSVSTRQWHSSTELIEGPPSAESLKHNSGARMKENNGDMDISGSCRDGICCTTSPAQEIILPPRDELRGGDGIISMVSNTEFSSPIQTFQSFGEAIPSPKFSDSERQFLLRTLGLVSPSSSNTNANPSCKRALLDSL